MWKIESLEQYNQLIDRAEQQGFALTNCFFLPAAVQKKVEDGTLYGLEFGSGLLLLDDNGGFFWTATADDSMPKNAAANGAYNIARKAQWAIRQIREADQDKLMKTAISPKNSDWLAFIQ